MELKRILAKDARSANEKAAALYGSEVLVISCNKVGSQTELIVAVDAAPAAPQPQPEHSQTFTAEPSELEHPFAHLFDQANRRQAGEDRPEAVQDTPAPPEPVKTTPRPQAAATAEAASEADADERLRGQALVALVREEIASLRREFQLSRLGNDLTGAGGMSSPVRPLLEALVECHAPAALRTLLVEDLLDCTDLSQALQAVRERLNTSLEVQAAPSLLSGTHALLGPCGAGKTLMAHRLVTTAMREMAIEDIALISCADLKPGAWSQMQILAAQTGIEVYRARDLHALPLLLEELGHRKLIVIDTAGSDHIRQASELAQLDPTIALHAVVPADASSDQLRRLHSVPGLKWQSLLLSKWDDQPNPWPLIGFLCAHPMPIAGMSTSDKAQDSLLSQGMGELVRWAVDKLQNTLEPTAATGMPAPSKTASPLTCLQ